VELSCKQPEAAGANEGKVTELVSTLAELKADKQLQRGAKKETKEKAKRDKAIKARQEAEQVNQSKCAITLQRVVTDGADLLKKPYSVLLLKPYYNVKVPATMKIADLVRVLFTSTVMAVALDVGDVAPGVGHRTSGG
jgi:hypothetical protein